MLFVLGTRKENSLAFYYDMAFFTTFDILGKIRVGFCTIQLSVCNIYYKVTVSSLW